MLEHESMFETLSDLEQYLSETGHPNYLNDVQRIRYLGESHWKKTLYAEVKNEIGKDTWFCDDVTDEFRSRHGYKPGTPFGGEFGSMEEATLN